MSLLLDTHILLWWLGDLPDLPNAAREAIEAEVDVAVSAASAWEIAIKRAAGKLNAPDDLADVIEQAGFRALAITFEHAQEISRLPPHHKDPFDRMLVAQARIEKLALVSVDQRLDLYDCPRLAL